MIGSSRSLSVSVACCALLGASLSQGQLPTLFFDTEIVSLDLSGSAQLPLGADDAIVDTSITLTRATDHNSSRSNKTSSNAKPSDPDDSDDVDPDDLDGRPFDLFSTIDVDFDLQFNTGPSGSPVLCPNGVCVAEPESPLSMDLDAPGQFLFDKDAPDLGVLNGGTRALDHRGHVTVLKIAFGGGGGGPGSELIVEPDGILLSTVPGTSKYSDTPTGDVRHSISVSMDLIGTLNGQPFEVRGLSGVMVEEGRLFNPIVPEPTSAMLLVGVVFGLLSAGHRRA